MSQISAKDVKDLRDKTGVGMMDCKKALEETGGDMQKAIEYLRKKGAALAAKRAGREASEGIIAIRISDDNTSGVIIELNCETDFVARGDDFTGFAAAIADLALENGIASAEAMMSLKLGEAYGNESVEDSIKTMTGRLGEKIDLKRLSLLQTSTGIIASYIHPGSQLGAIVELATDKPAESAELARDIAMQVAASSPIVVDRSVVPAENIEKEKEIFRQQALSQGKPEQFVEKIVTGRLEKYYQEVVLLEQPFIKDSNSRVQGVLEEFARKNGAAVSVTRFVRYQLGA
ncbi:translation elongation factor Ts [Prosthecochloris aestuarii DSM 271]|uniref:Elongation factor Ts n=1 Tax=Prosthecochloris aestuarii (strain DSM 271 / SK 413) TaxID=290512 RepID=EFTS_PROA2|nr:translation elongation factor Ts [Prosthecochloris aestuarii]B4S429.1 RecName: Full=Elongation factor Ts; Short=EF-Ts [Prosthecochloris aestuarii DSM 271]ACF46821.1 translation elongation factor Ts [Prosthecochloris aestuarii DSM 271]